MVTWQVNGGVGPRSPDSESYALPALSPRLLASHLVPVCPLPWRHLTAVTVITDSYARSTHRLLGEHGNFHLAPAQVFGVRREVVLAAHLRKKVVIASR